MDDWADEKESLVSVSVSDEEKKSTPSNGDEQAGPSTSISTGEQKKIMAEGNGEKREDQNGETGGGTGIINSIASKFGVTVPGLSTKEEESAHNEERSGGIINQIISNLSESLPMSEDDVPADDEASLLIFVIED